MLRVALIGAGRTVVIGHAPALQALHETYRVVAICDTSPEALDEVGILLAVPRAHRYTDYRALLAQEDIDVVSVAVPHVYHNEIVRTALNSGAHVITERPLALSVADANELVRLAEEKDKRLLVLHYYLYYPPFAEAVRLVEDGEIGKPFFVRCEGVTGGYGPGTSTYHPAWHADPGVSGGGVWMDSGYHCAYLCARLLGSPIDAVAARIATYATDLTVDDTAVASLYHANGGISSIQVAWSVPSGGQRVFEIYGTDGTIVLDHEGYALGVYSNTLQSWRHPEVLAKHAESFIGFYRSVANCLQYGAPPPVSHREAVHTLEIVAAGYRANEKNQVATVVEHRVEPGEGQQEQQAA